MLVTVFVLKLYCPTFRHKGCIRRRNETTSIWIHFKVNLVIVIESGAHRQRILPLGWTKMMITTKASWKRIPGAFLNVATERQNDILLLFGSGI